ncbi:hypothetical protein Agub_g837 [Astrephomene gubernaculifera]|uniref:Uncharacterized protein n=1 Tax=Astrephomene gubernaculifera TaxID=47775 RepID=A0AAD3HGA4_9CHLO|nr:hypothetical protein Agub_g837 [Astrephomene gubernaculifera]
MCRNAESLSKRPPPLTLTNFADNTGAYHVSVMDVKTWNTQLPAGDEPISDASLLTPRRDPQHAATIGPSCVALHVDQPAISPESPHMTEVDPKPPCSPPPLVRRITPTIVSRSEAVHPQLITPRQDSVTNGSFSRIAIVDAALTTCSNSSRGCLLLSGGWLGSRGPRAAKTVRWLDHVAQQAAADVVARSGSLTSSPLPKKHSSAGPASFWLPHTSTLLHSSLSMGCPPLQSCLEGPRAETTCVRPVAEVPTGAANRPSPLLSSSSSPLQSRQPSEQTRPPAQQPCQQQPQPHQHGQLQQQERQQSEQPPQDVDAGGEGESEGVVREVSDSSSLLQQQLPQPQPLQLELFLSPSMLRALEHSQPISSVHTVPRSNGAELQVVIVPPPSHVNGMYDNGNGNDHNGSDDLLAAMRVAGPPSPMVSRSTRSDCRDMRGAGGRNSSFHAAAGAPRVSSCTSSATSSSGRRSGCSSFRENKQAGWDDVSAFWRQEEEDVSVRNRVIRGAARRASYCNGCSSQGVVPVSMDARVGFGSSDGYSGAGAVAGARRTVAQRRHSSTVGYGGQPIGGGVNRRGENGYTEEPEAARHRLASLSVQDYVRQWISGSGGGRDSRNAQHASQHECCAPGLEGEEPYDGFGYEGYLEAEAAVRKGRGRCEDLDEEDDVSDIVNIFARDSAAYYPSCSPSDGSGVRRQQRNACEAKQATALSDRSSDPRVSHPTRLSKKLALFASRLVSCMSGRAVDGQE